jgi:HPt (histidine-containing phosphotransfer) domain-containing protein
MNHPPEEFLRFLESQRLEYRQMLPAKLAELQSAWGSLAAAGSGEDTWVVLERMAHNLAGSAGTFGFSEIGEAAKLLERAIQARNAVDIASAVADLGRSVRGNG